MNDDRNTKIQELLLFSDRTLIHLNSALKEIDSAGNWGAFNTLTKGLLESFTKNDFIDDVSDELSRAKKEFEVLKGLLLDLDENFDLIDVSEFLDFACEFFDGFVPSFSHLSDLVQSEIIIRRAISEIEAIRLAFASYNYRKF